MARGEREGSDIALPSGGVHAVAIYRKPKPEPQRNLLPSDIGAPYSLDLQGCLHVRKLRGRVYVFIFRARRERNDERCKNKTTHWLSRSSGRSRCALIGDEIADLQI